MPTATDRFFEVFEMLIASKQIRCKTFCDEVKTDRPNFIRMRKSHAVSNVKAEWLTYLVERFNVSANWLLTGKGTIFNK